MNTIFLDIDGVLTSQRQHLAQDAKYLIWSKFDPVAVEFLNKICEKHDAKVVLISTWAGLKEINGKDEENNYTELPHWIWSCFINAGFRGDFGVPWRVDDVGPGRGAAVADYIEKHDVKNYIVFDDNDYGWKRYLKPCNWVHTSGLDGMLTKHMNNAKSILGEWE